MHMAEITAIWAFNHKHLADNQKILELEFVGLMILFF